jgi:hypothetical protein
MSTKEQLIQEIAQSSDDVIEEVLNFLLFTKQRRQSQPYNNLSDDERVEKKSKPIWESFNEFTENLPEEAIKDLPTDSAANLDNYLYGNLHQNQ